MKESVYVLIYYPMKRWIKIGIIDTIEGLLPSVSLLSSMSALLQKNRVKAGRQAGPSGEREEREYRDVAIPMS